MLENIKALNENEVKNVNGGAYRGPCFFYQTARGETVSGLAQRYHTTVEILYDLNDNLSGYNPNLPLPERLELLIPVCA